MTLGQYNFKPNLFALLTIVLLCSVFIRLGMWQLDRAKEVTLEAKQLAEKFAQPAKTIDHPVQDVEAILNQQLTLTGHFLNKNQILRDNIRRNSKIGYLVFTPFKLANVDYIVMVNQGWVGKRLDKKLPDTSVTTNKTTITGVAKHFPKVAYRITEAKDSISDDGKVWLYFDPALFEKKNDFPIANFLVEQLPTDSNNFLQQEPSFEPNTGKHYSYAIQWFSFNVLAIAIFIFFNLKSKPDHD